ncbi:MAG: MFS transporter [Dehalococcoidia bacterium]|nr:MAG: MFS transporter [Dehalococcoidia bacterium]
MLAAIDGTAVIVAFPAIVDEFQTNVAWVGWVITAYSLMLGITLPLVGRVVDLVGQRRAFLGAVTLFLSGSLGCALSQSVEQLVACRVLEGVGGGAFMPLAAGIVAERFPTHRARMIGLLTSFYPLGGIIGPNVGGLLVSLAGWRAVFLISVPVCLAALLLGGWLLTSERRTLSASAIDFPGALLLGGGTLALMTGLTFATGAPTAWQEPRSAGLVVLGVLLFGILLWWEQRAPQPILEVALIRQRLFLVANVLSFGIAAFVFAIFGVIPLFLTRSYGFTPSEVGLLLTPRALVTIACSALVSFLLPRLGFRWPLIIGFTLAAASTFLLALPPRGLSLDLVVIPEQVLLAGVLALAGIGMGFVLPAANSIGMDLLPEKATAIAGMRGACNVLGNVLGTTLALLVVSLAATPAAGLQLVFRAAALGLIVLIALTPLLPSRRPPSRVAPCPAGVASAR